MRHTTLVWHRHDLRLDDNHLYRDLDRCISVYIFDPAAFARSPSCAQPEWDVTRTGPHAAQLLLAAVASLRASLRERGGELLVRCGDPASVLTQLVHHHGVDEVAWHEEPGSEEVATSLRVRSMLRRARCRTRTETGCTLYHPDDLPQPEAWATLVHPRQKMRCRKPKQQPTQGGEAREWRRRLALQPRIMNEWRRAVRAVAATRPVLSAAASFNLAEGEIDAGELPSLTVLLAPALDGESARPLFGLPNEVIYAVVARATAADPSAAAATDEAAAHARLARFVNGDVAAAECGLADVAGDGSSKLSVPLALGLLSPRHVAAAASAAAAVADGERNADGGAGWLVSHMEMRDFFLYSCLAAGPALFRRDGWLPVQAKEAVRVTWRAPADAPDSAWQRWATGRTALPQVIKCLLLHAKLLPVGRAHLSHRLSDGSMSAKAAAHFEPSASRVYRCPTRRCAS